MMYRTPEGEPLPRRDEVDLVDETRHDGFRPIGEVLRPLMRRLVDHLENQGEIAPGRADEARRQLEQGERPADG